MQLNNPDGSRKIKRCNTQFVDDDDGWASAPFDSEFPRSETVRRMQNDAQRWNNINNIPGQTIAFHKCKWQILAWHVINGDLEIVRATEDILVLRDNKGGSAVIEFLPPDQPNKGLGYYLCPDGNHRSTNSNMYMTQSLTYATKLQGPNSLKKRHAKPFSNGSSQSSTMVYMRHISLKTRAMT